jgi:hypothetical protein
MSLYHSPPVSPVTRFKNKFCPPPSGRSPPMQAQSNSITEKRSASREKVGTFTRAALAR